MDTIAAYIPQDRRQALALGTIVPDPTTGAALLADISGFTPLTEEITQALGPRHGAEELTLHLNAVYAALIAEVERYGGSVLGFAGDAITCWFDESRGHASQRAIACALALQGAMRPFTAISLPNGATAALALKVTIGSGPARRFVVGDPNLQLLDTLTGASVARMATAEKLAHGGEVLVDAPSAGVLGASLAIAEWREDADTHERFAVVSALLAPQAPAPWPQPAQPLLAEQVRPWLFAAIFDRERSGQGIFLTEFRPAVALFLRFVGLDYEQEDAGILLNQLIGRSQAVLARYEGTLMALTIGDKGSYFYAVFGAPVAHEDDARRAVKAALDLRQIASEISMLAPIQIGISRGTMRAGSYGSLSRRTYGVLGDEVNQAARLMSQAAPGEVLVSSRVRQALTDSFSFEPRAPVRVKGKAEPLSVFAVTGRQERRAIRLQDPEYALPMIGRRRELALVDDKMILALQGHGQIVALTAEAGLGKSRMVAEVIRLARRRQLTGYGGTCQSDGVSTSYLVWWPIWRAFFDVDAAAPLRKQMRNLEGELEERAPQRVEALPLLGSVLGLPLPDNDFTRGLAPMDRKSILEALLLECVKSAAHEAGEEGGGLLFVLEDLHWIDPASYDLLEALARASVEFPVLILLAYRPLAVEHMSHSTAHVEALPHFTQIMLTELSRADAEQAIRAKWAQLFPEHSGRVPSQLIERITARAQGNPFYVEELLNYLHDRGLDLNNDAAFDDLELPASVHSLVLSRIDQLSVQQQLTLKVASIIGRMFRFSHLCGYYPALGKRAALKGDLDALAVLELTPLDRSEPELTYLFKHIVTREAAYESLAYRTRAALHEQYARFIEAHVVEPATVDETLPESPLVDLLAYHYDHSDNLPKKREYLRRAGEAAVVRYANVEALDYLSRALALTPATDLVARYALLLARETVYGLMGVRDAQVQDLTQLEALSEQLADSERRAVIALHRAAYAESISDYPVAMAHAQQAVAFAHSAGAVASEAQGYLAWGSALWHQADYAAASTQYEQALALARQAGLPLLEADALRSLGILAEKKSDYAEARAFLDRSLEIYRTIGDRRGESKSLNSLGVVAYNQSDYGAARAVYDRSLRLKREIGDRHGEGIVLSNLGVVAEIQNDYFAARAYFDLCLSLCREIGDREGVSAALAGLGSVALHLGDPITSLSQFEQALSLAREIGDQEGVAEALAGLGSAALHLGDYRRAQTDSEQALNLAREIGDQRNEGNLLGQLGQIFHDLGNAEAALDFWRQALVIAQEVGALSHQGDALIGMGHVLMSQGHLDEATDAYARALELGHLIGEPDLVIVALAGLAHASLRRGDRSAAYTHTQEILTNLDTKSVRAGDESFVYLTLYRVLDVQNDVRAESVLERAHTLLQERANKIADEFLRRLFLENVPWQRELVTVWKKHSTN